MTWWPEDITYFVNPFFYFHFERKDADRGYYVKSAREIIQDVITRKVMETRHNTATAVARIPPIVFEFIGHGSEEGKISFEQGLESGEEFAGFLDGIQRNMKENTNGIPVGIPPPMLFILHQCYASRFGEDLLRQRGINSLKNPVITIASDALDSSSVQINEQTSGYIQNLMHYYTLKHEASLESLTIGDLQLKMQHKFQEFLVTQLDSPENLAMRTKSMVKTNELVREQFRAFRLYGAEMRSIVGVQVCDNGRKYHGFGDIPAITLKTFGLLPTDDIRESARRKILCQHQRDAVIPIPTSTWGHSPTQPMPDHPQGDAALLELLNRFLVSFPATVTDTRNETTTNGSPVTDA